MQARAEYEVVGSLNLVSLHELFDCLNDLALLRLGVRLQVWLETFGYASLEPVYMCTHLCLPSDAFIHLMRLLLFLHLPLVLIHYLILGADFDFDLAESIHRDLGLLSELIGIELPVLLAGLNESRM